MTKLFLVAPNQIEHDILLLCAKAAVAAGDCASILISPLHLSGLQATVQALQTLGLATLLNDCPALLVKETGADGLHLADKAKIAEARKLLNNESLGYFAGASRHDAMEAAEAGVDYVAFAQNLKAAGEPIVGWWHDIAQLPSVAFDPVSASTLTELLLQNPDFIRPSDVMWQSPEACTREIAALTLGLNP